MSLERKPPPQLEKSVWHDTAPPMLYHQVTILQWNQVIARCVTHPHEAHYQDRESGITALHVACRTPDTPPRVVHALLKAYPKAAALQTTHYASMPLHFACWRNLSETVIRMLLQVYPRAASTHNGLGLTPLHLAARTRNVGVIAILLQTYPQAACSASVVGHTPLHLAIRAGAAIILSGQRQQQPQQQTTTTPPRQQDNAEESQRVIVQQQQPGQLQTTSNDLRLTTLSPYHATVVVVRRLIEGNIAVLHIKDRDGETPLCCFCHHMEPIVHKIMVHARSSNRELHYLRQHPIIRQCWETFQLLVKAAAPQRNVLLEQDSSEMEMVHAMVQNLDCLENYTFSLLTLKLCRDQLQTQDYKGDLPVHILSSISGVPQRYGAVKLVTSSQNSKSNEILSSPSTMNAMHLFLAPYRAAASTPNRGGDYPLHLVLRHNAQWEDGVEELLHVHPAAVTIPDKESGLYPFMMAAAGAGGSFASMTTLFQLIRICPEFERFIKHEKDEPSKRLYCTTNVALLRDPTENKTQLKRTSSTITSDVRCKSKQQRVVL